MSEQNPYEQLGVTEESSFEEIQEAKQRLVQQYQNDSKIVELIEAAYDSVLMDRLRMRQEGRIKVPDRIRFPERLTIPVESKPVTSSKSPNWWQSSIDTPSAQDIGVPAVIYACLGAITLLVPDPSGSLLPLLLAFGVFVNIYFFNRKEKRFGRALLFTLAGLVLGVALGAGLASLAAKADLNIFGDRQIYALVTFLIFWVISSFFR
ncbi:MAG: CPP1-like family protein [Microcystis sp.]|uniref:Molecular chaperone DnaJ n=2 Tax=Microcystis TaxID=1125 RepID=I4IMH7_MICAE|nr:MULTISPECIES: CPP1-like family protein [Microcystis]MCA2819171.1 CPP1-like family protein [Microcystis sp. M085S1]MCA2855874.1 CPP1-like family protein [Microcystis sp. M065S1]MCZ8054620.1 CPP1-like family protein [Microcystis sp. LE19-12.2C]MDJ0550473.1 CPP1-like family protein [Microcystis sp. M49637_WE12]TRT78775.1 MAG: molecular chaperone DnaJ [Microcystis flos-aquae Ma_QC_C_20070823_S18]TRT91376.1 MAG: molecular chaperone DnaJ [Microcystis flos-aquae Ma_QC_C_20070823_S18D]TRV15126.1 